MWLREPRYRDREEAGRVLAARLREVGEEAPLVLAIPNGGVAVGAAMGRDLGVGLYLIIVRKIQFPDNPEAGFGAVGSDGTVVMDERLIAGQGMSRERIEAQREKALQSVRERVARFGERALLPNLRGRTVILVDDGLATGSTMEAAIAVVRAHQPGKILVAVPTASHRAWQRIRNLADELLCPDVSRLPVFAVANAYERWYDVEEEEVIRILESFPAGAMG